MYFVYTTILVIEEAHENTKDLASPRSRKVRMRGGVRSVQCTPHLAQLCSVKIEVVLGERPTRPSV